MSRLQIKDVFEPYYEGRPSGFFSVKAQAVTAAMDIVERHKRAEEPETAVIKREREDASA